MPPTRGNMYQVNIHIYVPSLKMHLSTSNRPVRLGNILSNNNSGNAILQSRVSWKKGVKWGIYYINTNGTYVFIHLINLPNQVFGGVRFSSCTITSTCSFTKLMDLVGAGVFIFFK